jgi:hypothetical protein
VSRKDFSVQEQQVLGGRGGKDSSMSGCSRRNSNCMWSNSLVGKESGQRANDIIHSRQSNIQKERERESVRESVRERERVCS